MTHTHTKKMVTDIEYLHMHAQLTQILSAADFTLLARHFTFYMSNASHVSRFATSLITNSIEDYAKQDLRININKYSCESEILTNTR